MDLDREKALKNIETYRPLICEIKATKNFNKIVNPDRAAGDIFLSRELFPQMLNDASEKMKVLHLLEADTESLKQAVEVAKLVLLPFVDKFRFEQIYLACDRLELMGDVMRGLYFPSDEEF